MPTLHDLMSHLAESDSSGRPKPPLVTLDVEAVRLRDAFALYHQRHVLSPGDIVRYKRGVSILSQGMLSPTGAMIVMEVRRGATPIDDVTNLAHNGVCFDVWLGAYDGDGDFIFAWSDSRRLEPFPEDELVYSK